MPVSAEAGAAANVPSATMAETAAINDRVLEIRRDVCEGRLDDVAGDIVRRDGGR